MASAPQANLPLFYNDLMPLNTRDHADYRAKSTDQAKWLVGQHAIPLTADEFAQAARHFPVVFSAGDNPVPLALMGLNEGVNTFVDDKGKFLEDDVYIPAYVRRYPFLLAKLSRDNDDMSLCFDPSSKLVGEFKTGEKLFEDGKPTQHVQNVMQFCERFEQAGQRTAKMVEELQKADMLMDGEVGIQPASAKDGKDQGKPFLYRGFRMVNQEKLRDLPAEKVAEWNKSGLLMLVHAHLMSLELMRGIFARQMQQGKGPKPEKDAATADAPVEIKSTN